MKRNRMTTILRNLPLLAPIPEAWAVGLAIHRELGWPLAVVTVAAVIVAGTGFWGVQVFNSMIDFNATLYKDERAQKMTVPTWQAVVILAVWFAGVTALTVFLDAVPTLSTLTPLGLVIVGFSAAYLYSLSNLVASRTEERVAYRQEKKQEKQSARNQREEERKSRKARAQEEASIRKQIGTRLQAQGTAARVKSGSKLDDATLLFEWTRDPYLSDSQMAERLMDSGKVKKVSRQAVSQRRQKMISKGLIVQNPDGRVVEYIEVGTPSGPLARGDA